MENVLDIKTKEEFRKWLSGNYSDVSDCYIALKKGKPKDDGLYYVDAVEVALCFGWIDSTYKKINGQRYQRFSPRKKNSLWTELNKERVRRLEKLGLMTEAGRMVLPDMEIKEVVIPKDVEERLKICNALENFKNFPELYKRIRIYNLCFYKKRLPNQYEKALENFITHTKANKTYGEWNDYGRLLNY